MSIFGRRPDPEQIASQLIEGLEDGTLTLDEPPAEANPDRLEATDAVPDKKVLATPDRRERLSDQQQDEEQHAV